MIKKPLNQNAKYAQEIIDEVEPYFIYSKKPINRFKVDEDKFKNTKQNKNKLLQNLRKKINSIENCNLKLNCKNLIMGDGDINSSLMLIGGSPGKAEDESGLSFQGEIGTLLVKMLLAINIKREKIYSTYVSNFRPPEDRKLTSQEIKRYSVFLKEHISIINPKIVVLMGSTALEAITGLSRISFERGKWKEILINDKTFPLITTFSPSYLIRFPENKKFSWEDLKSIKKKIQEFKIKI